jgi:hypothetical protein
LFPELLAEDAIAIPQQVAWEWVSGESVPQLLAAPFCRRVLGHVAVDHPATIMSQHQEHVEDLELNGGYREKIEGDEL